MHIIDHFGFGGAQRIFEGLSNYKGDTLYFYALRKKGYKEILPKCQNVCCARSTAKYSFPIFEIKRFIEKEKIEILHLHLPKSIFLGIVLKSLFFRKIKVIVHEHGDVFETGFLYTTFLRGFQSKVNLFIAVSKATKEKLMQNAGIRDDKIKVLYNFVDLDKFNMNSSYFDREKGRKKLGIKKDEFVVGFAGRLVERKGWREFIEAARILSFKSSNIKFLMIGDGPDKENLVKLIKKYDIENKVNYLGFVPDIDQFYCCIDCYVMPSHWEPSPMIFYEVQAKGIPLICADVVSVNELVKNGENGLTFDISDSKRLAQKIELLYGDRRLRDKLRNNGLINIKKYSLDAYLKRLEMIYSVI